MTPRYHLRVAGFTLWAQITGWSFVIRHPHPPYSPRFIARSNSRELRVFPITLEDKAEIYEGAQGNIWTIGGRKWRPESLVERRITKRDAFNRPPPQETVDFRPYKLVGPRLTQGYGLIGHNIRVALGEEYGRWPGERGVIAGLMYSWTSRRKIIGQIPAEFLATPGVEETLLFQDAHVVMVWQDLATGVARGPLISAFSTVSPSGSAYTIELPLLDELV